MIRRGFLWLLKYLARTPISSRLLQRAVRGSLLFIVVFYRIFLSRWMGRVCLFHESCSAFTLARLRGDSSFQESMKTVCERLSDCSGNYSLLINANTGELTLKAESERQYEHRALSSFLRNRIDSFSQSVLKSGDSLPFDPSEFLSEGVGKTTTTAKT